MEDSLNYMNAVSEAGQSLNQITALKQEAAMRFEEKRQELGQELELPSEISITTAGGYLGKKILGMVAEKIEPTITEAAGKIGISEDTIARALGGDISGALEQGAGEVLETGQMMLGGTIEGAITTAETMAGQLTSAAESVISEATQAATGILGRVSSGLSDIPSLSVPSISTELSVSDIYSQGLEDLRAQTGMEESMFREYGNVSLNEMKPQTFNDTNAAGSEIEMTDFSSIGTPAAETAAATETVATTAETAGEAGAVAAETVGEVAGAEAAGAALDATGILAPLGALVGFIGGIVGFFEGHHKESEAPPIVATPILNPATQFL